MRRVGPIRWAPISLDLSLLKFFLREYGKNDIYKSPNLNSRQTENKIADEIDNISRKTLSDISSDLVKRMHLCISVEREHIKQLL